MINIDITEADVMKFLIDNAKLGGSLSTRALVVNRVVNNSQMSLQRTIRIALIVATNNEALVDFLIKKCLDNNNDIYFVGSDVNFQSHMEIDYLFFESKIKAKTK